MIIVNEVTPENLHELVTETHPDRIEEAEKLYARYLDNGFGFCFSDENKPLVIAGVTRASIDIGVYWGTFSKDSRDYKRAFFEYAAGMVDLGFDAHGYKKIVSMIDTLSPRNISFITRLGFKPTDMYENKHQVYEILREEQDGE